MPLLSYTVRILACSAVALFGALAFPGAARAQCLPPGSEPYATQTVCNFPPEVNIMPPSTSVTQPSVPVSFTAFDHYSENAFTSLRVILDGDTVTPQWSIAVAEVGSGTGRAKRFTSTGTITLSAAEPQRTLSVRLCDLESCVEESRTYTLSRPGVAVTPDAQFTTAAAGLSVSDTFRVTNHGTEPASFALQAFCRTGTTATSCSASPAGPLPLAPGGSQVVTVTFAAPVAGSVVSVALTAPQTGTTGVGDAGWKEVTIGGAPTGTNLAAPGVALVQLNSERIVERSQCVTAAAGTGAAYECGDLRLAHALPAHRTMGRTWAPVLLYNSQHAQPRPVVYYDVTLPVGAKVPGDFLAVLYLHPSARTVSKSFPGSDWAPGTTRRIAIEVDGLTNGLHFYYFQVIARDANGQISSPVSDGIIPVVDRSQSPFGSGWWLAGAESLCLGCGQGLAGWIMWTGGDGSVRAYRPLPGVANRWIAPMPDGPEDTLAWNGTVYTRTLRGGGRIEFDASGQHLRTVNRLGQVTSFVWSDGIPVSVTVPVPAGGGAAPHWQFYKDGTGLVTQIHAVEPSLTGSRGLGLNHELGDRRITYFQDPDDDYVVFAYGDAARPRAITARTDRRGTTTRFGYGATGRLASARVLLPSTADSIVTVYDPVEAKGLNTSVALAQAYTRLDGPRTDVLDHTYIWPSRHGLPARTRDALGAETVVEYDAGFPALATKVTAPTGVVSTAVYDARGRVSSSTVTGGFGGTESSTTTYAWDDTCDRPLRTAAPGADTVWAGYDPGTCNLLWQQQGRHDSRMVSYGYYPAGHAFAGMLDSIVGPLDGGNWRATERLRYDARGNLRTIISPLGFLTLHLRDALGRDSLTVTPTTAAGATGEAALLASGVRQQTVYDVMDRVVRTVSIGPAMAHDGVTGGIVPWTSGAESVTVETQYDDGGLPLRVTRWATPDTAGVDSLVTTYAYDEAGRKLTEADGFVTHEYAYDTAGNVVRWTTPRAYEITSEYDVLNRLVRRVVPAVSYARICPSQTSPCTNPYPYHPNGPAGSLVIPEEWTTYRYDRAGNQVYAENADAIVKRTYFPNGALATDSLAIRTLDDVDFTAQRYGLSYGYDTSSGRVTAMQHPLNLAGAQALDVYGYNRVTGALDTLTDRRGHRFTFHRAANGQLTSLRGPAYTDSMRYDLEGRLVERRETATLAGVLHHDSLFYDGRGKLLRTHVGATNGRGNSVYLQWYSGLGMLVATDWRNEADAGRIQEAFGMDALGNTAWRRSGQGGTTPEDVVFRYALEPGRARVDSIRSLNLGVQTATFYPERTTRTYDPSGNADWAVQEQTGPIGTGVGVVRDRRSRSFYGADERLRYFNERDVRVSGSSSQLDGVWEEYRYDPLGRRVLVNTRTMNLCNSSNAFQCASATTRMVWAGDQLLWEIRGPSGSPGEVAGPADAYGTVSYTHGAGIDRPLVITKGSTSVLPHQNWRGQFSRGTKPDGASSDCPPGVTTGCSPVKWPGWRATAWHDVKELDVRAWWGGQVDGMRDVSGQMYMRNRYYDPATGQFTQQDPIGLAGGLNSYGFAAGDPVTYSDPYGLVAENCIPPIPGCQSAEATRRYMENHRTRNQHNTPLPQTRQEAAQKGSGFNRRPQSENALHRYGQGADGNVKYTAPDGREAIYDANDRLVTVPTNAGTFNYDPDGLGHVYHDVLPYLAFGNGPGDRTTFLQRVTTTIRAVAPPVSTGAPTSYGAAKCAPHCE